MGKFDGILICTDLDGTILRNDKTISEENICAMEYFKSEGGIFTFITGRMPFFSGEICNMINPNAPFGCINGAGLYDPFLKEYVWTADMAEEFVELVECVDKLFPNVGIQINTFNKAYFCKDNDTMQWFREVTKLPNLERSYKNMDEPVAKVVFGSDDEDELNAVAKHLTNHPLAHKFGFIRSEAALYEILPKESGKGTAVKMLAQKPELNIKNTIAVGDYNNDISMFRAAGVGIAVSNACKDALAAADYVTVSNEEHAIADVIFGIESGKYKI